MKGMLICLAVLVFLLVGCGAAPPYDIADEATDEVESGVELAALRVETEARGEEELEQVIQAVNSEYQDYDVVRQELFSGDERLATATTALTPEGAEWSGVEEGSYEGEFF